MIPSIHLLDTRWSYNFESEAVDSTGTLEIE